MFYDAFKRVCAERGETPTKVLETIGISKNSYSNWKNGADPLNPTKKKIADYFGITVERLMAGDPGEIKTAPEESEAEREEAELWELREQLRRDPNMRMLFSLGKNMTADELRKSVKMLKTMFGEDVDE